MSQYGATQNSPYTGQQDSELVNNPRYQGQSGGTGPQGATGPQQESRYGAAPLSTTGMQHGQQHGQQQGTGQGGYGPPPTTGGYGGSDPNAQAGYGGGQSTGGYGANPNAQAGYGSQTTGGHGANPNAQAGYGSQTTGGYGADPNVRDSQTGYGTERAAGMVDPNTRPGQGGYGSQPTGGYGAHHQGGSEYAKEQPGYGQPGFGAASAGQHTGDLWPQPASPPNAHKHDLMGQGQGGYGQQQPGQGTYGQQQQGQGTYGQGQGGYDQPPRKEGVMDKVKDAVGMGPRSQGAAPGQGYNPSETTGFGGGHGHPHGGHDQSGGGYNTGMATGADAYTQSQPRKEGMADKAKDAVGMGPNSGYGTATGGDAYTQSQPRKEGMVDKAKDAVGMGPNSGYGTATGGDAYTQSQPRKEGIVDKAKDAVGMGPNSGYDARTQTGNDAYVHGNHPAGMQDRVQGVNEPSLLGGEYGVNAPVGRRDGVLRQGEHVPDTLMGETRTEPGYDASKGHLPGQGGHHQNVGGTGLGGHHNTGKDTTDIDERRGKRFEDTTGPYDSKFGTGTGTGTGTTTGADTYHGTTGTGSGYDDPTTGSAPPKKGLMTKIKEKLHQ